MISGSFHALICISMVAFPSTMLLFSVGPVTAFMADIRFTRRSFYGRTMTGRTGKSFPSALAAAGFGKTPTGKPTSSKKKKKAKTQRNKNPVNPVPTYIPYDSEEIGSGDSQQATRALLEWLDEEEVEGLEGVEIGVSKPDDGSSPGLRGVFAKRDFMPGEYMVAVPYVTTLLVDEDFDPTSDPGEVLLRADEPEVGLKFWQNFLCHDENDKKYKAFLDCLPMTPEDPNFDGTPDFWSIEDIRRLEIPGVVDKMLARKEAIAGFMDRLSQDRAANEEEDDTEFSALSTIQQCCWLVQSRAFTTYKKAMNIDGTVGLLSRVVLIPFIDMINHASRKHANAEMQVVETKEYDESFYALVATQPIRKGIEIKICYGTGEETSLEIFSKYGFWPKVEDSNKEKEALQKLLENVEWSTTLEEDQAMLETEEGAREPMRTILSIRIYAKSLLL